MRPAPDGIIPPHQPNCYGCGPENAAGLQLQMRVYGDSVLAELMLDDRFEGAPGLAHGGAIAAALDDLFGGVIVHLRQPAVTAQLIVNYRKPVLLDTGLALAARCDHRDGRKLHLAATVHSGSELVADATALFIAVDRTHFNQSSRPLPNETAFASRRVARSNPMVRRFS